MAKSLHSIPFWYDLQLNNRTSEVELLQAFSQFGRIVSHTIRRATSCAYIDFDESHAATLARRAMNGALLGGSALRVEFKVGDMALLVSGLHKVPKCAIV